MVASVVTIWAPRSVRPGRRVVVERQREIVGVEKSIAAIGMRKLDDIGETTAAAEYDVVIAGGMPTITVG